MKNLLLATVLVLTALAVGSPQCSVAAFDPDHHLHNPGADRHQAIYKDGLSEDKAMCNVCTDITVPALDEAIFKSTPNENWKTFIEDVIHSLPAKYRYDIHNHEVVDHDDAKHGTDPCEIVQEQVYTITHDPHTHASVAALAKMFHADHRVKSHLRRMATHILCHCHDDVGREDGEFHNLMENHVHYTDRMQLEHDLHHEEYEVGATPHAHLGEPKEEVRVLTKKELEDMEWQTQVENHEATEHGDKHQYSHGMGPEHPQVQGDQGGTDPHDRLTGEMGMPEHEGDDKGDHPLNLDGLGVGHNEL